jgi:ribosomal protein S18 acetylase RimI-like enzyme
MDFAYRKIEKSDYGLLREMLYEALFVPEGEKPYDESVVNHPEISRYIDNWGKKSDFGIIVHNEQEIIGAIWGRIFLKTNKGFGFVDEDTPELTMAVKSEYRNQGFGKSLMIKFLQFARESGYKHISLSVDKRNRAVDLYKRMGFKIIDEIDSAYTMIIKID